MAERTHLIGIGGIGVSAVARALLTLGESISGSDARPSAITRAFEQQGVPVSIGHRAENVHGATRVVVSTAIMEDNAEIAEARRLGIPIEHRSHSLNRVVERFFSLGVSGTNGKGTVSSMLTVILEAWGVNPSFLIGGILNNYATNARISESEHLVVEIDESDGSLVNVRPDVAILTNLELDHLNYYSCFEDVLAKVREFLTDNPRLRFAVVQSSDEGSRSLLEALEAHEGIRAVTFSSDPERPADYFATDVVFDGPSSSFDVWHQEDGRRDKLGRVTLPSPGLYNVENALAAIAASAEIGAPFEAIQRGLGTYAGLNNRFTMHRVKDSVIIKDYISHPTGMRRVLRSLRQIVGPELPVVAIFKPYRYTMIRYLGDEYARSFEDADHVVVTDMWEANEEPIPGINTAYLADKIRDHGAEVAYVPEMGKVLDHILNHIRTSNPTRSDGPLAAIFFGGDDLFEEADRLSARLALRDGGARP